MSEQFLERDLTPVVRALQCAERVRDALDGFEQFSNEWNDSCALTSSLLATLAEYWIRHPLYHLLWKLPGIRESDHFVRIIGLIQFSRCRTISGLWKYSLGVPVDGKMQRWKKGELRGFNAILRPLVWKQTLHMIQCKTPYAGYYSRCKESIEWKLRRRGIKVLASADLPTDEFARKYEPNGTISRGHINARAIRKTAKLFLAHLLILWWREVGSTSVNVDTTSRERAYYNPSGYLV